MTTWVICPLRRPWTEGIVSLRALRLGCSWRVPELERRPVLFPIARTWKQPKYPSTDEWIKKMWYVYTMEYYSAIKRNKIGSFVETWMDLGTTILSEISHTEKDTYPKISLLEGM